MAARRLNFLGIAWVGLVALFAPPSADAATAAQNGARLKTEAQRVTQGRQKVVSASGAQLVTSVPEGDVPISKIRADRPNTSDGYLGGKLLPRRIQHYRQAAANPTTYRRVPAWSSNDGSARPVTSCEEYVHDRFRDWSRFEDAVTACRDDDRCIWDAAFKTGLLHAQGNSPRLLRNSENQLISPRLSSVGMGQVNETRNAFIGADLVRFNQLVGVVFFGDQANQAKLRAASGQFSARQKELKTAGKTQHTFATRWRALADLGARFDQQQVNELDAAGARGRAQEFRFRLAQLAALWSRPYEQAIRMTKVGDRTATMKQLLQKQDMVRDVPAINPIVAVDRFTTGVLDPRILPADGYGDMAAANRLMSAGAPTTRAFDAALQNGSLLQTVDTLHRQQARRATSTRSFVDTAALKAVMLRLAGLMTEEVTRFKNGKTRGDEGASCLASSWVGCDFDHADVLPLVDRLHDKAQEDAYRSCTEAYGTSAMPSTLQVAVRKADGQWGLQPEGATTKRTPSQLDRYGADFQKFIEQELKKLPVYPGRSAAQASGVQGLHLKPRGQDTGGSRWYGNDDFGAGYEHSAGWKVTPLAVSGQKGVCALKGEAWARLSTGAKVFGIKLTPVPSGFQAASALSPGLGLALRLANAVNTNSMFEAEKGAARMRSHLVLFGEKIYAVPSNAVNGGWKSFSLNHAVSSGEGGHIDIPDPRFSATFTVFGFPITIQSWGELGYGFGYEATTKMNGVSDCLDTPSTTPFDGHLQLVPNAGLSGFLSIGVGVPGLQMGVRGSLTLLQAQLPIDTHIALQGSGANVVLQADAASSLVLDELSGKLQLFAEALLWEKRKTLIKWSGFHQQEPLFALSENMNLFAFCEAGSTTPGCKP